MINPSNRYPVISEAEIDAHINESKRLQEEAIEAEHARKAHAEGDRLEVEETERTRKSRAEAIATAETDAFYALHPIQFGRNQETAAEMLGDGRGEIPAIETWPEVLFLNANEEGDLLPMLEYDLENVYWTGDSPALSRHIKYIRADLVERLIADAKGM